MSITKYCIEMKSTCTYNLYFAMLVFKKVNDLYNKIYILNTKDKIEI